MNHIIIAGRIDTDPVRKEVNDSVVCTFRLASGRSGSKGGRLWIDVEAWGHLAGTCYQHAHKGRQVIVAGRLTQKQWPDPTTGEKRTRYLVAAADLELLAPTADQSLNSTSTT